MNFEYDPIKNDDNYIKHGVSLSEVEYFEWETAIIKEDLRLNYPERRFEAKGYIEQKLYILIFCFRENNIRVISFRKANRREYQGYAKT